MAKIERVLLLTLATLILTACFFEGASNGPRSGATVILQFQGSSEELKLSTLQVANHVYPDVTLMLSQDGSWRFKSIGQVRPMAPGESVQAVLTTSVDAVLNLDWQPDDATITIRRIHIDDKVFGDVPLRLSGRNWFWGNALQAGRDLQDVHELKALTISDYQVNPALAASEEHHTFLHSAPGSGMQSFPMRLSAGHYRFCMDRQDGGADQIRLLDPAGTTVVGLRAGDACVEVDLDAGLYTMQHWYGGLGAKRAVFFRPAATPPQSAPNLNLLRAEAQDYPEYWALYLPATTTHAAGFLSFNRTFVLKQIYAEKYMVDSTACLGAFDAAAQLDSFSRAGPGELVSFSLFNPKHFFRIIRDSNGVPSTLSYPLACPTASDKVNEGRNFYLAQSAVANSPDYAIPLVIAPNYHAFTYPPFLAEPIKIVDLPNNMFRLAYATASATVYLGFDRGTVMSAISEAEFDQKIVDYQKTAGAFGPTGTMGTGDFRMWFRFFPNGLPPSMTNSDGDWSLEAGEVALFSGTGCSGAAMLTRHTGVLPAQRTLANGGIGDFSGSVLLGLNTVATTTQLYSQPHGIKAGTKKVLNQSGCLNQQIDLSQQSLEIAVTKTIKIQTNSCEYCNLAGIDLSDMDLTGVKLQHANLTGAMLSDANLTRADLRSATLQGTSLNKANLETANLCQAVLNGRITASGTSGSAAQLSGAHLKDANLSGANLDGANFSHASFYSSALPPCQPASCSSYALPTCASAYKASMNNTNFNDGYLAGVDMGSTTASAVIFTSSILFGASLNNAVMNVNHATGKVADFTSAFLQGADFTNASLDGANFTDAYFTTDGGGNCMQVLLQNELTAFPGFKSGTAGSCVAGVQKTPTCIQYAYGTPALPATTSSNYCPDGKRGPCTDARWTPTTSLARSSQKNSACLPVKDVAPLCDGFTQPLNTCW